MKKIIMITIFFISIVSCSSKMALFAPRRTDTENHRAVKVNSECRECHFLEIEGKPSHEQEDDCMSCHKIM